MKKRFFYTIVALCMVICSIPTLAQNVTLDGTVERASEGKYFADITVENAPTDSVLVVALYDGDEMTGVAISENISENPHAELEIEAENARNAKFFVLKSISNLSPVCKKQVVDILVIPDLEITTAQTVTGGTYKNVIVAAGVADGDVTLENVTIRGNLTVSGGGSNSVNLDNCTVNGNVVMNKASGEPPRLNLTNTKLSSVEVMTEAIIDTTDYDSYIEKVVTVADITVNSRITPLIEVPDEATDSIVINVVDTSDVEVSVNTNSGVEISGSRIFVTTTLDNAPTNVTKNGSAIGHICVWDQVTTISEATCSSGGSFAYVCNVSGSTHIRILDTPASPHNLTGNVNYGPYQHWFECSNCTNMVEPVNHSFPTGFSCSAGGKCTECDYTIAAGSSHRYGMYITTTPPTCSKTGIQTAYCEYCGNESNLTMYKLTHTYTQEPTRVDEPTCTAGGYNYFMCQRENCTYEKKTALPASGHTTDVGYDVVKEASCTEEGTKAQICTRCNTTIKTKSISKTPHTKNDGTVTQAATCISKGITTYICTNCSTSFTEEIPYGKHCLEGEICSVCSKKEYVDVATSSELTNNLRNGQSVRLTADFDTVSTAPPSVATIYLNGHTIDKLEVPPGDIIVDGSGGGSIGEVVFRGNVSSLTMKNTDVTTKMSTTTNSKAYLENCTIQYLDANYSDLLHITNSTLGSNSKINLIKDVKLNNISSANNNTLTISSCNNVTINGATGIGITASGSERFTVNHSTENPVSITQFSYSGTGVLEICGGTYKEKVSSRATEEVILNNAICKGGFSQSTNLHKLTVNGGEFSSFATAVTPNGTARITGGTYGTESQNDSINISGGRGTVVLSDLDVKHSLNAYAGKLTVSGVKVAYNATFNGKESLVMNDGTVVEGSCGFTTDGLGVINGGTYKGKSTIDYYDIYKTTGSFEIKGGNFGDKNNTREALAVYTDAEVTGGKFSASSNGIYIYDDKTVKVSGNVEFDTKNVAMQCYKGKLIIEGYKSSSYYILADNTYGTIESADEVAHNIVIRGGYLILREGFTTDKKVSTPDQLVEKPKIFFEDGIVLNGDLALSNALDGEVEGISGGILGGTYNGETTISGRNTNLTIAGGTFEKITFTSLSDTSVVIMGGTFKDFNVDDGSSVIIIGGTFNVDVSEYVNTDLYSVVENPDGSYSVIEKED